MQLYIGAAGRLREPYWRAACDEYRKRLGAFCRLTEREFADTAQPEAPAGFVRVALCLEGDMLTSEQLADKMRYWQDTGSSRVAFLIGGSEGLDARTKAAADFRLSLSRLTWPHHMVRAMLLEQLYRSFQINGGGKYHK